MKRRVFSRWAALVATVAALGMPGFALAADEAPEVLIKRLSDETLAAIKADRQIQSGDISRILALVESYGGRVELVSLVPGHSTTAMLDRMEGKR